MRDFQRSRCYRAERAMRWSPDYEYVHAKIGRGKMADVERYLYELYSDPWLRANWPNAVMPQDLILHDGRGTRTAAAWHGRHLQFPRWSRTRIVILHEVAHLLNYDPNKAKPGHGESWCDIFLKLVQHYMGFDAFLALRQAFIDNQVKFSR